MIRYRNRPLNNLVTITMDSWASDVKQTSDGRFIHKSGIEIASAAATAPRQEVSAGYVKAFGPGAFAEDGGAEAVGITIGARVLFSKYGGRLIPNEHGMMDVMVSDRDLICITEVVEGEQNVASA